MKYTIGARVSTPADIAWERVKVHQMTITKLDLTELRSFLHPPPPIIFVATVFLTLLLGQDFQVLKHAYNFELFKFQCSRRDTLYVCIGRTSTNKRVVVADADAIAMA